MKQIHIIAVSFFFSAWGDRLWGFAVGLYLVKLTPGSLQLAAIYGLALTTSAILFSPVIGDWIDRTNRLKAVRLLLILTNVFIILCAIVIVLYLYKIVVPGLHLQKVMQGLIILLGALANITGVGEKICISKDWIVVTSKQDQDTLSKANALLRRIDLSVAILAPVGVGLLMSIVSDLAGIIFICTWDILTMFVEYSLLLYVYRRDPDLWKKKHMTDDDETLQLTKNDPNQEDLKISVRIANGASSSLNFIRRFKTVVSGWKVYQRQPVVLAGVALAWLYLTVLGFNAITTSYAYSQGLKELYVSICYGLGSFFGVSGTFIFPIIRNKIGLAKTGLVGNIMQVLMLSMCAISIWLPGSPSFLVNKQILYMSNKTVAPSSNPRLHEYVTTSTHVPQQSIVSTYDIFKSNPSILVFMAGIILSRAGLWIADLTITQLQQEHVLEEERGTVGGVQFALNSCFNLLHYIITSALPYPNQFWILILMSIFAVLSSFVTYIIFNFKFARKEKYELVK